MLAHPAGTAYHESGMPRSIPGLLLQNALHVGGGGTTQYMPCMPKVVPPHRQHTLHAEGGGASHDPRTVYMIAVYGDVCGDVCVLAVCGS